MRFQVAKAKLDNSIHAMHAKQGKVKHQKSKSVKISQSNRAKVKKESQAMKYVAILTQRLAKAKSKAKAKHTNNQALHSLRTLAQL